MPLIATTLQNANEFRRQFGLQPNDTWTEMAKNAFILRENNVTLEFSTMNGSTTVKQADVVLATYPLSYNDNYGPEKSLSDLNYVSIHPHAFANYSDSVAVFQQAVARRPSDDMGHLRHRSQ